MVRLRHEIPLLETQHSRLVSGAKSSAWCVVMEYFHIFRNGARPFAEIPLGPEAWLQRSEAQQQLSFLQSSMSDDVVLGSSEVSMRSSSSGSGTRPALTICSSRWST